MTPHYDLHCHSIVSDGTLPPGAVVERAAARGVTVLALTDHDEVGGLDEAAAAATALGIELVPGTELSVTWRRQTLHVLGLQIDRRNPALLAGIASIREGRAARARAIAESLERAGIPGSFEGAMGFVRNPDLVSRTHFARYLVEAGKVRDMKDAFRRYLSTGRPGYVEHVWASLAEAVAWIGAAGGQAVLAHPGRYKLSREGLRDLLAEFRDVGGAGIEVNTSNHTVDQSAAFAALAREFGLLASCGSDFHGPGESWMDFGGLPDLPRGLAPVWQRWS